MRVWVNDDRTTAVHLFDDGTMHVLTREHMDAIWGPPVKVDEEPLTYGSARAHPREDGTE